MDFDNRSAEDPGRVADDDERETWKRVGRFIADRIENLRLTDAQIKRRGGPDGKTLKRWIAGEPITRPDREVALCAAIFWTHDSIARIRQGMPPLELTPTDGPPRSTLADRDFYETIHPEARLARVVEEHERQLIDLLRRVDVLERMVAAPTIEPGDFVAAAHEGDVQQPGRRGVKRPSPEPQPEGP